MYFQSLCSTPSITRTAKPHTRRLVLALAVGCRKKGPPPRFVRPKMQPGIERDFGVLVFAPPHPPPPPEPPAEAADASQAHGADQSPVARRLFDAETRWGNGLWTTPEKSPGVCSSLILCVSDSSCPTAAMVMWLHCFTAPKTCVTWPQQALSLCCVVP